MYNMGSRKKWRESIGDWLPFMKPSEHVHVKSSSGSNEPQPSSKPKKQQYTESSVRDRVSSFSYKIRESSKDILNQVEVKDTFRQAEEKIRRLAQSSKPKVSHAVNQAKQTILNTRREAESKVKNEVAKTKLYTRNTVHAAHNRLRKQSSLLADETKRTVLNKIDATTNQIKHSVSVASQKTEDKLRNEAQKGRDAVQKRASNLQNTVVQSVPTTHDASKVAQKMVKSTSDVVYSKAATYGRAFRFNLLLFGGVMVFMYGVGKAIPPTIRDYLIEKEKNMKSDGNETPPVIQEQDEIEL